MADNVAVSAGSGTTIAADEVSDGTLGSCKVQFVKIMDGTLDGTSKGAVGTRGLHMESHRLASVEAASSTITRPADTTAYASGDLVANSTTAGHARQTTQGG